MQGTDKGTGHVDENKTQVRLIRAGQTITVEGRGQRHRKRGLQNATGSAEDKPQSISQAVDKETWDHIRVTVWETTNVLTKTSSIHHLGISSASSSLMFSGRHMCFVTQRSNALPFTWSALLWPLGGSVFCTRSVSPHTLSVLMPLCTLTGSECNKAWGISGICLDPAVAAAAFKTNYSFWGTGSVVFRSKGHQVLEGTTKQPESQSSC